MVAPEKPILDADGVRRALTRIAHEILERHQGAEGLLLVGLRRRGVPLAERLAGLIEQFEGQAVPVGELDVTMFRDDLELRGTRPSLQRSSMPQDVTEARVVLIDDVLYTGRTVRAALEAILSYGRPREIQLAVLVDRGHRELPIRADYVGKNLPTAHGEQVAVRVQEIDGQDEVVLVPPDAPDAARDRHSRISSGINSKGLSPDFAPSSWRGSENAIGPPWDTKPRLRGTGGEGVTADET